MVGIPYLPLLVIPVGFARTRKTKSRHPLPEKRAEERLVLAEDRAVGAVMPSVN
jgi:hypothetical protein